MKTTLENFRKRLTEYRHERKGQVVSVHVNALEMSLCLLEYAVLDNRKIQNSELKWFKADLQLEYVFGGSEWEDLIDYYDQIYQMLSDPELVETPQNSRS